MPDTNIGLSLSEMPPQYWIFVFLTLSLVAAVGVATYRTSQLLKRWRPDRNLLLLPAENAIRLLLIVICIGLGWLSGLPPEQLGWTLNQWPKALFEGIVWGLAMAAGIYAATQFIIARSGERFYSRVVADAILPNDRRELIWTTLAMIGIVISEELLFRSLLLGGLQPILPVPALIVLTSLLFGFLHLPQGSWGVAGTAIAAAILGLLFIKTGNIIAPIAAHYVANMVQIKLAMGKTPGGQTLDG